MRKISGSGHSKSKGRADGPVGEVVWNKSVLCGDPGEPWAFVDIRAGGNAVSLPRRCGFLLAISYIGHKKLISAGSRNFDDQANSR